MVLDELTPIFNTQISFKEKTGFTEAQVLEFFRAVMKAIPALSEYTHEDNSFVLSEKAGGKKLREIWCKQEEITLAFAPSLTLQKAHETASIVYPLISQTLNPNLLLLANLNVSFRFAFPYLGNQDALLLNEIFKQTPLADLAQSVNSTILDFQPGLRIWLGEDHSTIAAVEFHTHTTMREIESGVYDGDDIEIVCGVAKTRGLAAQSLLAAYNAVYATALPFVTDKLLTTLVKRVRDATTSASRTHA